MPEVNSVAPNTASEQTPPPQPSKKFSAVLKKKKYLLPLLLVLALLGIGGFLLANKVNKTTTPKKQATSSAQAAEQVSTPEVPVEAGWKVYNNTSLGFSINIPENNHFVSCKYNSEKSSYYLDGDVLPIPTKVFEDGDTVYVSTEYYYNVTGEKQISEASGSSFIYTYSGCEKTPVTLSLVKPPGKVESLPLEVITIKNEVDLTGFVKTFGACTLTSTRKDATGDWYNLNVTGDGKPLDQTDCFFNVGSAKDIKYYPDQHKLAYWQLGQYCHFESGDDCLDDKVVATFKLLP